MKKFWKYIAACAVVASLVPLTACDDDDTVDPYDINYVYLYQPYSTFANVEYKANGDFMSGLTDPLKTVPVRITKPAPSNLQIEVAFDPTLVDEYNEANGTEYKFLEGARIDNPVMTIAAGEYISPDSITISFGDHSGFMTEESNLILPVVIRSGSGLTISKSSRIFLTFNSTYRPNNLTAVSELQQFKAVVITPGWEETVRTLNVDNAFYLSYDPYEEVKINLAIDQSKVAEYNAENGTNYAFKSDASLASNTITIGTDSNRGSFTINTGDLSGIENEGSYLIPVTISSIEGGTIEVTDENKTVYVLVKGIAREMTFGKSNTSGSETTVKAVSCTVDGEDWTDKIDSGNWDYGYINTNVPLEIDFGQTVNLASFYFNHWYASYAPTSMSLETSVDGTTWINWGTISYSATGTYFINLLPATNMRYMRIVFPTGPRRIEIDGMEFYVK